MVRHILAGISLSTCLWLVAGCNSADDDNGAGPATPAGESGEDQQPTGEEEQAPSAPPAAISGPPAESSAGDAETERSASSSSRGTFRAIGRAILGGIADAQADHQAEEGSAAAP